MSLIKSSWRIVAQISPKSICLIARVPVKSIDALPWGFAGGMHIRHLAAGVAMT